VGVVAAARASRGLPGRAPWSVVGVSTAYNVQAPGRLAHLPIMQVYHHAQAAFAGGRSRRSPGSARQL